MQVIFSEAYIVCMWPQTHELQIKWKIKHNCLRYLLKMKKLEVKSSSFINNDNIKNNKFVNVKSLK